MSVLAKLASMRKPQSFTVYPAAADGTIIVQSDNAIGRFDPSTRKGVLNYKGSNPKYFLHLNVALGATPYEFPADFVEACVAQQKGNRIV
jgi:hypothetical protein